MPITDSLFSHIHNDAYLVGSRTLEGQDFIDTTSYLFSYAEAIKLKKVNVDNDKVIEYIEPLLERLKYLKSNTIASRSLKFAMKGMTENQVNTNQKFHDYTQKISTDINLLSLDPSKQNSLMITGGWKNSGGGHAMAYEFKRDKNGDIIFIIHNSGAGINFHNRTSDMKKDRFCPIKVYRIPQKQAQSERLSWFVGELTKPNLQMKGDSEYSAERIYNEVIPKIAFLGAELEDPYQFTKQDDLTAGQRSGTCAEKVLHQIVEQVLPDKRSYHQFIYGLKKYALDEYTQQVLKEDRIDDPGVRNQISLATENMSRLLLKEEHFDDKRKNEELKFLRPIQEQFKRISIPESSPVSKTNIIAGLNNLHSNKQKATKINLTVPKVSLKPSVQGQSTNQTDPNFLSEEYFNFETDNFLKDFDSFLEKIDTLSLKDTKATVLSVENFLRSFPFEPSTQFNNLQKMIELSNIEQKTLFLNKLNKLKEIYIRCYKTQNQERITTQYSVAQLSFIAIIASLNKKPIEDQQRSVDIFDIIHTSAFSEIVKISSNPYFNSENYLCDQRLTQIQELLMDKKNSEVKKEYGESSKKSKALYEDILKKCELYDGLQQYYTDYCEKYRLPESEKVYDHGEGDIRTLFLMEKYISGDEDKKNQFIDNYCKFYNINSLAEIENIKLKFKNAESEIYYQHNLALAISKSWATISNGSPQENISKPIIINSRGYTSEALSTPLTTGISSSPLKSPQTIKTQENTILSVVLNKPLMDANQIQMSDYIPWTLKKPKEIKLIRELLHLKSSPFQILSTVDFFTQHLSLLKEPDMKLLVENYIFHPGNLSKALKNEPATIEKLHKFIQLGMQAYNKTEGQDLHALYFRMLDLKLSVYFLDYYAEAIKESSNKNENEIQYLHINEHLNKQLSVLSGLLEKSPKTSEYNYSLNFQKVLLLSSLLKHAISEDDKKKLTAELISSLFALKQSENIQTAENMIDTDIVEDAVRLANLNLTQMYETDNQAAEHFLLETIEKYLSQQSVFYVDKLKDNKNKWKINLPYLTLYDESQNEIVTVNLACGKISRPGLNKALLPPSVINDANYMRLFGNYEPEVLANNENNYFEFDYHGIQYRIIKENGNNFIQRQYDVFNQGKRWYQAADIKDVHPLQTILQQSSNIAWVSLPENVENVQYKPQVLIGKASDQTIQYCYNQESESFSKLDEFNHDSGFKVLPQNSYLHQLVSFFEDPEFVLCMQNNEGYQVHLPRYDMVLDVAKIDSLNEEWEIRLQGSDYKLDLTNENLLIPGLKSALLFKSEKDKKIIIPIQPFIIEDELKMLQAQNDAVVVYAQGTGSALISPTSQTVNKVILDEPENRFDQKKQATGEPILDDPGNRFDHKKQGSKEPILDDPGNRFDHKKQNKRPILDDPGNRFEHKKQNNMHPDSAQSMRPMTDESSIFSEDLPESLLSEKTSETPSRKAQQYRSEYYNLTQDISDNLRQDFFSSDKARSYLYDKSKRKIFNQYHGTAKYSEYTIDNNVILPKSMQNGLYLAYVYLCSNLPEKAFETLDYCEKNFGNLSGSDEELDYLQWIVFEVPAKFKDSSFNAEIETPESTAVKLKALSLLARFKRDNPNFQVTKRANLSGNNDEAYSLETCSKRDTFYRYLDTNIYALYHRYLHTQTNVPENLQINDHDKLILLRAIYATKARKPEGPIGVSWRKLEGEILLSELNSLVQKSRVYINSGKEIPTQLVMEIESVKALLEKEKKIGVVESTVQSKKIIVHTPTQWNYKILGVNSANDFGKLSQNKTKDLDISTLFKLPINEIELFSAFPRICDEIYIGKLNAQQIQFLVEFAEQAIKSYSNQSKNNENSNLFPVSSCLYLLLKNIDQIRKGYTDTSIKNSPIQHYKLWDELKDFSAWEQQMRFILSKFETVNSISQKENVSTSKEMLDKNKSVVTSRSIINEVRKLQKDKAAIQLSPYSSLDYSVKNKFTEQAPQLIQFYAELAELEMTHSESMKNLTKQFNESQSIDNFEERSKLQLNIDNQAGVLLSELEQAKLKLSVKFLGDNELRHSILEQSKALGIQLNNECQQMQIKICDFANQNFDINPDVADHVDLQLGLLGRKQNRLAINDLLRLYLNNDMNETMLATKLTQEESQILHDEITKYLALSIQKQQYQRISKELDDKLLKKQENIDDKSSTEVQQVIANIGQLIADSNLIEHDKNPALTLFQYDQNILIRKVQKEYIDQLLELNPLTKTYNSKIIQLIMGGGKSKVLLPILALKKATGENLSIIEVPEALYQTNLADLNQISLRLFGQHAYGFHFDRNTVCDSAALKQIFRQLKYTSANRGYVVTTRESMASLELKYHELLSNPPVENKSEWEKQIKWLDRIINFRTNRADVLIDEIDSSLDIRRQINFTIGDKVPIPENQLSCVLNFYKFMDVIQINEKLSLIDLAIKPDPIAESTINELLLKLAENLVIHPESPLFEYLPSNLSIEEKEHIQKYLLNQTDSFPPCIENNIDQEFHLIVNILKGELSHLLEHTLSLKLFKDYGTSNNPEKSILQRLITIPYSGNNEPSEKSKDTNYLKTINLTIQSTLINGIPHDVLTDLFEEWLNTAKAELLESPELGSIDNTTIGKSINRALLISGAETKISNINLENDKETTELYNKISLNRKFIFYTLSESILPEIKIENKVLTHNPLNHASLYRSVQGVTGTPSNWRTLHQKIHFDEMLSLGTDGLTIARLKAKKTQVHHFDYVSPKQFLKDAITKISDPEKLRVISDVGATFRGISNFNVAHEIAEYALEFNNIYSTSLKYVLYFDKNPRTGLDELYALSVENPKNPSICLTGKSSSDIEMILKCTPNEYFTYYDEKHTRGSDIKQDSQAKALVTVDKLTVKKDFCQGVMRMREFAGAQSVDVIVSNETKSLLSPDKPLVIDDIIDLTERNQNNKLMQDHFASAIQKMENIISSDLNGRILNIPSKNATEKQRLHKLFEPFFVQIISDEIVKAYGNIEIYQDSKDIFENCKLDLMLQWKLVLEKAGITIDSIEMKGMNEIFDELIKTELRNCKARQLFSVQKSPDQTAETKQEMRSEQSAKQRQQQEQEMDDAFELGYANHAMPLYWTKDLTLKTLIELNSDSLFETPYYDDYKREQRKALMTYPMPQFDLAPDEYDEDKKQQLLSNAFDSSIRRSYNFIRTHHHDEGPRIRTEFQKQVHAVLMIQTQGKLQANIITFKEAEHIEQLLEKSKPEPPDFIWIMNTQETKLAGEKPANDKLHPTYSKLLQQLRFYNGDLAYLINEELSGSWMMDNFESKLKYFEKHILPYRLVEKEKLSLLRSKIAILNDAYHKIVSAYPENLNSFSWRKHYPLLSKSNELSLRAFSKFYEQLTRDPLPSDLIESSQPFYTTYYFKLILQHGTQKQFENYISLIDDENLKAILNDYLNEVDITHDYESIVHLYETPAFQNNHLAREVFNRSLGDFLAQEKRVKGLYTHANFETMSKLLNTLSQEDRISLIKTLNGTHLMNIFNKDIQTIRLFFDNLPSKDFFNAQTPELDSKYESIPDSYYGKSSYNYLLKEPEKFDYLLKYAQPEYLIKLFSPNNRQSPFYELLALALQEPDTYMANFNTIFDLVKPHLSAAEQTELWRFALSYSANEENIDGIDVIKFVSTRVAEGSFIQAIKSNAELFLDFISLEKSSIHYDYIWNEICKMDSEEEKYKLLTNNLSTSRGWRYRNPASELESIYKDSTKPDLYYRLKEIEKKHKLIEEAKKAHHKYAYYYIDSELDKYIELMTESPSLITPLSEIEFHIGDKKVSLKEVILNDCKEEIQIKYNQYFTTPELEKRKQPFVTGYKLSQDQQDKIQKDKEQDKEQDKEYTSTSSVDSKL